MEEEEQRDKTDGERRSCCSSLQLQNLQDSCNRLKPHKANDAGWEAIRAVKSRDGNINLSHFKLVQRLGSGDIGSVYLAELRGFTSCLFAIKVMDKAALASRNKLLRANTERAILEKLDHPFLPTLYAHFHTANFSCLVMEYCPGGDLHTLRQRQLIKRFDAESVRFYAAEILLAIEYLHMMGVIYRDLKPENVLVREDGHIMLSDFDLSLICEVSPTVIQSPPQSPAPRRLSQPSSSLTRIDYRSPSCILPACVAPYACAAGNDRWSTVRAGLTGAGGGRSTKVMPLPELVAEPTGARSMSFVGTHEYLAPEIIAGFGHGSAVDWWTLGIFLYEMLYGRTPFKGSDNESTLMNVLSKPLVFDAQVEVSDEAKNLIKGLLAKDPSNRIASGKGAVEIKQHPFFAGINWALIRCAVPPEIPRLKRRNALRHHQADSATGDVVDYF